MSEQTSSVTTTMSFLAPLLTSCNIELQSAPIIFVTTGASSSSNLINVCLFDENNNLPSPINNVTYLLMNISHHSYFSGQTPEPKCAYFKLLLKVLFGFHNTFTRYCCFGPAHHGATIIRKKCIKQQGLL